MTYDWRIVVLLICVAVITLMLLLLIVTVLATPMRNQMKRLLERLPSTWHKLLYAYARRHDALAEPEDTLLQQGAGLLVVIICWCLPIPVLVDVLLAVTVLFYVLQQRNTYRMQQRRFAQQWPACLDMLAMLLQAGLSFRAALNALASLNSEAIALQQLRMLHQQVQAGISLEEGLDELALRIPHPFMKNFIAAVMQARVTGGTLAATLSGQAEQARSEQQLEAEKLAQEIGVKLLLPLVSCFFPVTFLLILGPIFIGFTQN